MYNLELCSLGCLISYGSMDLATTWHFCVRISKWIWNKRGLERVFIIWNWYVSSVDNDCVWDLIRTFGNCRVGVISWQGRGLSSMNFYLNM